MRHTDDRLRRQVEHVFGFVQADRSLEGPEVLDRPVEDGAPLDVPAPQQLGLRVRIPDEHRDVGVPTEQLANQPRPYDPGCAGNEHSALAPEIVTRHDAFVPGNAGSQGGSLPSHRLLSSLTSRSVSMHCQNPSWRYATSCPSCASRSRGERSKIVSSASM